MSDADVQAIARAIGDGYARLTVHEQPAEDVARAVLAVLPTLGYEKRERGDLLAGMHPPGYAKPAGTHALDVITDAPPDEEPDDAIYMRVEDAIAAIEAVPRGNAFRNSALGEALAALRRLGEDGA